MKLSGPQRRMLADTFDEGDPYLRIHGLAKHGGAHGTLTSLIRHKLLKPIKKGYQVTAAGRAALFDAEPWRKDKRCPECGSGVHTAADCDMEG